MTQKLFRSQAIDHQRNQMYGDVLIITPFRHKLMAFMFLFITIMIMLFFFYAEYTRKITATGHILPAKGITKVFAPNRGIIKKVHIKDGEEIKAGQVLFTLSNEKFINNTDEINQKMSNELLKRSNNIKNIIHTKELLHDEELKRLSIKINYTRDQISQIHRQIKIDSDLVKISDERFQQQQLNFNNKIITKAMVESSEINLLEAKSALENSKTLLLTKENEFKESQTLYQQQKKQQHNELLSLQNQLSELAQNHTEVNSHHSYVIKSPIDGFAAAVEATDGQSINLDQLLMNILPNQMQLYAELFLPSKDIGLIEAGKKVLLKFDAFPYQRYGIHKGEVEEIASTTVLNNPAFPQFNNQPTYKTKVKLTQQYVSAYGKKFKLQVGMTLKAEIILERYRARR